MGGSNKIKQYKDLLKKIRRKHIIVSSLIIAIIWFILCLPNPLFPKVYATEIQDCEGIFLSAQIASDYQWRFPESDSVPYKFKKCIITFEDEYFRYHPGINPLSLYRAVSQNFKKKKVFSGGSTITMQLARMVLGNRKRTIVNKLYELVIAFRLELSYSKEEILTIYASHAPFGGNIVGIEAASWRYFKRSAYMLSWGETAALAVLPNSPALVFPGKNHQKLLLKRNRLLDKLRLKGIIDKTTCDLAKNEPLPGKPKKLPQNASHLLLRAIKDGKEGERIQTTVDSKIQDYANYIAKLYAQRYSANYINNIAICVADTKTGEVKAYVGNVELDANKTNKFVDIIAANRSSGSILKPFLYASMLYDGLILPHSLIPDIPTRIGDYSPENFDKTYMGSVAASQALAHSLNIPMVRMLRENGIDKFYYLLHSIGFTTINKHPNDYGLTLILGGADISLWEATSMYASLGRNMLEYTANKSYKKLDYRLLQYEKGVIENDEILTDSKLDAGSLWYTLDVLSTINRPWDEIGWEYFASTNKIAWKTGTSFGHRDAWAIGVTPEYTVGIWVGNAGGEGRPGLTGLTHAAPVMFEIFKYLKPKAWFVKPLSDMKVVNVCKTSGYRATEYCESEKMYIPKQGIKVKSCPYHISIFLDSTYTYRVTSNCYSVNQMKNVSWFNLPPAQEWYYKQNHPNYKQLPVFMQGCSSLNEKTFDIIHPENNTSIFVPKGFDGVKGKLIFEAIHRNSKSTLYWHLDGEYISLTKGIHKLEISPEVGSHILTVVDDTGNTIKRKFTVVH